MGKGSLKWTEEELAAFQARQPLQFTRIPPAAPAAAELTKPTKPTKPAKPAKYRSRMVKLDGITFASELEARRWQELTMLERAGKITDLERQVGFELAPSVKLNGRTKPALRYFADAVYRENGRKIVEDTKSPATLKTAAYRIKKHLMMSVHGIEIREITYE